MRAWSKIREVEYTRGGNVSYESARGSSASRRAQPFRDLNVSNTRASAATHFYSVA